MYPFAESDNTKALIPHFVGFGFIYCRKLILPLNGIIASSTVTCSCIVYIPSKLGWIKSRSGRTLKNLSLSKSWLSEFARWKNLQICRNLTNVITSGIPCCCISGCASCQYISSHGSFKIPIKITIPMNAFISSGVTSSQGRECSLSRTVLCWYLLVSVIIKSHTSYNAWLVN